MLLLSWFSHSPIDVFALGMVLWEIAAREVPFAKVLQEVQVLYLIKHERKRPPIPAECPRILAEVIERCWNHEPEARPSANGVLSLLEALTHQQLKSPCNTHRISHSAESSYEKSMFIFFHFMVISIHILSTRVFIPCRIFRSQL